MLPQLADVTLALHCEQLQKPETPSFEFFAIAEWTESPVRVNAYIASSALKHLKNTSGGTKTALLYNQYKIWWFTCTPFIVMLQHLLYPRSVSLDI